MSLWDNDPFPGGGLVMGDLPPYVVQLLLSLPELLHPDQSADVKDRLYPAPQEDEDVREEWERLMAPELFALVASARDIVSTDLEGLSKSVAEVQAREDEDDDEGPRLVIPSQHVNAWISALNVARLTLGAQHELVAGDMEEWPAEGSDPVRSEAILRVNLLGEIQGMLIHGVTGWHAGDSGEGEDGGEDGDDDDDGDL